MEVERKEGKKADWIEEIGLMMEEVTSGVKSEVTVLMLDQLKKELTDSFQSQIDLQNQKFNKLKGTCDQFVMKMSKELEESRNEVSRLKNELIEEKGKVKELEERFTTSVQRTVEEIVQITLRVIPLEEGMKKLEEQVKAPPEPPPPPPPPQPPTVTELEPNINDQLTEILLSIQEDVQSKYTYIEEKHERLERKIDEKIEEKINKLMMQVAVPVNRPILPLLAIEDVPRNVPPHSKSPSTSSMPIVSESSASFREQGPVSQNAVVALPTKPEPTGNSNSHSRTKHGRDLSHINEFLCLCGESFKKSGGLSSHIRWESTGGRPNSVESAINYPPPGPSLKRPRLQETTLKTNGIKKKEQKHGMSDKPGYLYSFVCLCSSEFKTRSSLQDHIATYSDQQRNLNLGAPEHLKLNRKGNEFRRISNEQETGSTSRSPDTTSGLKEERIGSSSSHFMPSSSSFDCTEKHGRDPVKLNGCFCGQEFSQPGELFRHIKSNKADPTSIYFQCSLCGKTFAEEVFLKDHLSKIHQTKLKNHNGNRASVPFSVGKNPWQ